MGNKLVSLAAVDVGIQLAGFAVSYFSQTEKLYDVTGSLTFLLLSRLSLKWNSQPSFRQTVNTNAATLWAVRLGTFLFYRVSQSGDARFDKVKTNPRLFFTFWMVQAAWIFTTLSPILVGNKNKRKVPIGMRDYIGWSLFIAGFLIETIADLQKLRFRADPTNAGKFINTGLWGISRHPNYFGEILVWSGLFLTSSSVFKGLEWMTAASPVFVYYLLNYVSGIPILERGSFKRYGHLPAYQQYIKTVPCLTPFFGRK